MTEDHKFARWRVAGPAVKVCGVTLPKDARLCAALGATVIGVIFAPESPRRVTLEQAKEIRRAVGDRLGLVGVFSSPTAELVVEATAACGLDWVQVHGTRSAEVMERSPDGIWQACEIASAEDVERLRTTHPKVRTWLMETVRRLPGGREKIDDAERRRRWELAASVPWAEGPGRQTFIAGELGPANVAEALRVSKAMGVDVAGGVESAPGVKDEAKLRAFFQAVKG